MQEHEKPAVIPAEIVMQVHHATGLGILDAKQFLTQASLLLYSRLVEAAQTQSGEEFRRLYDPIEEDPESVKAMQQAEKETQEALSNSQRQMGFCHLFWNTKQRILKEKYGIEWFTPVQMNPGTIID
jgi:hypothetical protein